MARGFDVLCVSNIKYRVRYCENCQPGENTWVFPHTNVTIMVVDDNTNYGTYK